MLHFLSNWIARKALSPETSPLRGASRSACKPRRAARAQEAGQSGDSEVVAGQELRSPASAVRLKLGRCSVEPQNVEHAKN